jgi:NRPS condensation-like uncharacterized protein
METIFWRIGPLLFKDLEIKNKMTAVAMQRCDKHASTTKDLLLETVFSTRSVQARLRSDGANVQLTIQLWDIRRTITTSAQKLKNLRR